MFTVEQNYDLAGLTVLCRAARKKVRRGMRVLRGAVWAVFSVAAALFAFELATGSFHSDDVVLPISAVVLLSFLLLEDRLNAWVALRQMLPGTARSTTVFRDEGYTVTTEKTETHWQYDGVTALVESERYFIFFLGKKHGQLFDKRGFRQGDPDAFRVWLAQKTGKTFQTIQ
ncbi:MAG: YcxB family protein [Oscillospiraceae bacterium]|nr:YcxB family protein [Oscillospiraceae bacterium]